MIGLARQLIGKVFAKVRRTPRAFAMFFATSLAARGAGIVCQLLQVPLVVHALGAEAFGLWMAMTSITNLALFADLGMGISAQNRLAEHFAHDESEDARQLLATVFICLMGAGVVLAAVALGLIAHLDFAALFHLHEAAVAAQAPGAARALAIVFSIGLPFALAQRLAFARQEGWMYNVAQGVGSVGGLVMVIIGTHRHWPLAGLVAGVQGSMVTANAVLLAVQLKQLHWLDLRHLRVHFGKVRELVRLGALFTVQQMLTTILFALPQVIISTQLGAAAVTPYNLVQRLFNLFAVIQNSFMLPLWPAYSQAKARGEYGWMRRALRHSLLATSCCSVTPMILAATAIPLIIRWWVPADAAQPTLVLVWLLCLWNALVFFQQPFSFLLAGVSEIRRVALYSVLSAACCVGLMLLLARPLGAAGVIIGLLAGYLPFNFIGNIIETRRYLRDAPDLPTPAPVTP